MRNWPLPVVFCVCHYGVCLLSILCVLFLLLFDLANCYYYLLFLFSFSLQCGQFGEYGLPQCKAKGHVVRKVPAMKRYFTCAECKYHVGVVAVRMPKISCAKCGSTRWNRAGMGQVVGLIITHKLKILTHTCMRFIVVNMLIQTNKQRNNQTYKIYTYILIISVSWLIFFPLFLFYLFHLWWLLSQKLAADVNSNLQITSDSSNFSLRSTFMSHNSSAAATSGTHADDALARS